MMRTWKNAGNPNFRPNFEPPKSSYKFKKKLMNETWENGKKPNFGPNFGLLGQIWHPPSPNLF